ncbi:MAG: AraC family transcriptional regulator [Ruminococcaceae bacterium]|nr:AraC family transcriptional regulator [Oscillospiraceae bacterium]
MSSRDTISENFYYEKTSQQKNTGVNQHYHNLFEIYYLEEGTCHYFVDNNTYAVEAGDVVLIPEGVIHKTVYRDSDAKRRLIYCTHFYIPPAVIRYLPTMIYVYRNKRVTKEIMAILDAIEREYCSPDEFSESSILSYMHMLFFLLARNRDTEAPRSSGNVYTTQTIAYIKENYKYDMTLSDLAARCAVTPEHLSRIFKRDTGFGISEYVSMIRLQQAQMLLRTDSKLSVAEVSERCGFSDSNYFSKRFKEMYGMSPLRFRNGDGK